MATYTCQDTGIFRIEPSGGLTRLCPPIAVLGTTADPQRPAGLRLHLAWSEHAAGPWHELLIPTPLVANPAVLEALLLPSGWRPVEDGWHDAVCAAAMPHVLLERDLGESGTGDQDLAFRAG